MTPARAAIFVAILTAAPLASADKAKAEEHYKRGFTAYNLGKFADAVKEFERAFEEEPDPEYLYSLAGAHRLATNYERAAFYYRRYLGLLKEPPPNKAEIDGWLVQLDKAVADKAVADKAAADKLAADKALADQAAADKAAADKLALELAQRKATSAGLDKKIRISFDAGLTIIHLRGIEADPRAPALGGRIAVSWIKRAGGWTFDLGGSWQITTLPYTDTSSSTPKATSAFFTQLHGTASAMRTIAGPVWARGGIGLGASAFGNLQQGNPVAPEMMGRSDIRMLCARLDWAIGYRYNPTIDFVLGFASGSVSSRSRDADPELDRVLTFETAMLGLYIKL